MQCHTRLQNQKGIRFHSYYNFAQLFKKCKWDNAMETSVRIKAPKANGHLMNKMVAERDKWGVFGTGELQTEVCGNQ